MKAPFPPLPPVQILKNHNNDNHTHTNPHGRPAGAVTRNDPNKRTNQTHRKGKAHETKTTKLRLVAADGWRGALRCARWGPGGRTRIRIVQEIRPGVQRQNWEDLRGIRRVVSRRSETETGHAQCLYDLS